jgi:GGDEF domain-containing protein
MIVVSGSELNDPFAVADSGRDIAFDGFLEGNGPLGEGYRHGGLGAIILGATAAAPEARLDAREFCVAPLRLGTHVHGVLAVAARQIAFTSGDTDLVGSTADQISLALERYRFLAVVQRQATVDDLTGLYNHRFLIDSLGQQAALAERLGAPLAILMLDIDHFKELNDGHGHQAGDVALSAFAKVVLGNVRRADLTARYGGEEFVVLMPDTSAIEAYMVAEKIRGAGASDRECRGRGVPGGHRRAGRAVRSRRRRALRGQTDGKRSDACGRRVALIAAAREAWNRAACTRDPAGRQCRRLTSSISAVTR